jgi:hypothetical protein
MTQNQSLLYQTFGLAWQPPDPQPTLPVQQGHRFVAGRPYAPPRPPTPGNAANPPGNVSAFGATPVYLTIPNATGAIMPAAGLSNPATAAAQGIVTAENCYIDLVNPPGSTDSSANGTTVLLVPGQVFTVPAIGAGVVIWVNAATSGHKFSVTVW